MKTKSPHLQKDSSLPASLDLPSALEAASESGEARPARDEALRYTDAIQLLECGPDAMVLMDGRGRIAAVNTQAEKMFGYPREQLVGEPVEKLMPQRLRNANGANRSRSADSLAARTLGQDLELYGVHSDGHEFPVQISLSPMKTEAGVLISAGIRDITNFKRVEELLRQRVEELEKLMDVAPVALLVSRDPECQEITGNQASNALFECEQGTNVSLTQAGGKLPGFRLCSDGPAVNPKELPMQVAAASGIEVRDWGAEAIMPSGARKFIWGQASPLRDDAGRVCGSVGAFQDVTASRLHTDTVLYKSREQIQLAVESAGLGVWGWTADRDELWASERTRELFGWPTNSTLNEATCLGSIHPDDRENLRRLARQAINEAGDHKFECRVSQQDGSVRWVRILGRSHRNANGTIERVLGVAVDFTERKSEEEALARQLAFETLRAELSAEFVNLPPDLVDAQILSAQKRICEAFGLDRSVVAQVTPNRDDLSITHAWAAAGFVPHPDASVHRDYPWYFRMLLAGKMFSYARVDDLPEEAAQDKEMIRRHGPKSSTIFPLMAGGRVFGGVAFGTVREEREWLPPTVEQLGLLAEIFANALARKHADEDLRKAYAEIKQLEQRLEQENLYLQEEIKLERAHDEVVGRSAAIRAVLRKAEQVARTDASVLLRGETGTGKELIARAIHASSRRKDRTMVSVNCAALSPTLIESELFGREKGAYTGALTREVGRFELANGSTLFLDEIGELPLELQAKLLRVLQEGEFERLGSPKTIRVDVRIVAATARDLETEIKAGKFREDLYYRLNVFPIDIPPLRERREDIAPLVWHFVNLLGKRLGRRIESINGSTMDAFNKYSWPGNIRELRNLVERFLISSTGSMLSGDWRSIANAKPAMQNQTLEEIERSHIRRVLESTAWHIRGEAGAAKILGMKPTTLESRMQKLGIGRPK